MAANELGLSVKRDGHVLRCTIEREDHRNALTVAVVSALKKALLEGDADPEVRVICLTGAGDRAFCSGADLAADFAGEGPSGAAHAFAELLVATEGLGTPLVARVNGHCVAGGVGLMLSCDLAIAADDVKVGTPEVKSGLFPMMIAPLILRHAGPKRAMEMMFTGRLLSAHEAREAGLLNRTVPRSDLDQAVQETIAAIAAGGPAAISLGRRALAKTRDLPFSAAVEALGQELVKVLSTEDAAEGISAFMEKRQPNWKNR